MTLTTFPAMDQRTPEWYDVRRGIVTASAVGSLLTVGTLGAIGYTCPGCIASPGDPCRSKRGGDEIKTVHPERTAVAIDRSNESPPVIEVADNDTSRALTASLVAERITNYTEETYISADMWRGIEDEPRARDIYADNFGPVTEVGFMVRDDWGFKIGLSPDGLVGDDGLIEIKSRRQKKQLVTVLADDVPAENMAQIQCALLVSGRKWCDYVSYSGGMHLWCKRVLPDERWHTAIVEAVAAFEKAAEAMTNDYLSAVVGLPETERVNNDLGLVF